MKMENNKINYEEAKIEIILLENYDIITTSDSAFDGEDDNLGSW